MHEAMVRDLQDVEDHELTPHEEHDVEVLGQVEPLAKGCEPIDEVVGEDEEDDVEQRGGCGIGGEIEEDLMQILKQLLERLRVGVLDVDFPIEVCARIPIEQIAHDELDGGEHEQEREGLAIGGSMAVEVVADEVARTIAELEAGAQETALHVGEEAQGMLDGCAQGDAAGAGSLATLGAVVAVELGVAVLTDDDGIVLVSLTDEGPDGTAVLLKGLEVVGFLTDEVEGLA